MFYPLLIISAESTGNLLIALTKGRWHRALMFSLLFFQPKQSAEQTIECWPFEMPSCSCDKNKCPLDKYYYIMPQYVLRLLCIWCCSGVTSQSLRLLWLIGVWKWFCSHRSGNARLLRPPCLRRTESHAENPTAKARSTYWRRALRYLQRAFAVPPTTCPYGGVRACTSVARRRCVEGTTHVSRSHGHNPPPPPPSRVIYSELITAKPDKFIFNLT